MTIREAMFARHMVRRYTDAPIPHELVALLNERVEMNNQTHGLDLALVTGNADGLLGLAKGLLGRNVNNYFVLAGPKGPKLDEKLGYCGTDLMLYAQTLGLNTWWVGGMYSGRGARKYLESDSVRINGVIAVGYGQTQGVQHKSKAASQVSQYGGEAPEWFTRGVEGLLLAPTAMNRQAYMAVGDGRKVKLTCSNGYFSGIDLGIGKYHFELGAGKENFEWVE